MHQVVKVLALVVDPAMWLETDCQGKLPGTPPERAEHMELLRSYKQKFLDPQVPSAFASLLAEAVENHGMQWRGWPGTVWYHGLTPCGVDDVPSQRSSARTTLTLSCVAGCCCCSIRCWLCPTRTRRRLVCTSRTLTCMRTSC